MKQVMVTFSGVSPLLMNPATDDLLDQLFGGAGARKPKDPTMTMDKAAAGKVIRNEDGIIGIPALYLFSCLVEAGRQVKIDSKRAISTKDSSLLPSFLTIEEFFLPFVDQGVEWKTDKRRGKLPKDGTAVCIVRPRFEKWSFGVTFAIDENAVAMEKVRDLVDRAGNSVGLGDFRPACRGPFGRFKVVEWEVI
jgi:hypothetical protein